MANLVLKNNTADNDVSLEFNRDSNASWRIINSNGTLYMRCNYTSSVGDYYDALSLAYDTSHGEISQLSPRPYVTTLQGAFSAIFAPYSSSAFIMAQSL